MSNQRSGSMSGSNGKPFQPDFVAIPYAVFVDPNLSHAAKLTYGRLKLYAGEDGRAFPKHETLASEVCLRDRQLRTVLSELQAAGWIEWRRARTNCVYTVFPDRQKTATLNDPDRQKTATQSGGKLPITSAENCHSRVAENCLQKRSTEKKSEKKNKRDPRVSVENSLSVENSKTEKASSQASTLSERFQEFWDKYPRKVGRDAACMDWISYVNVENEAAVFACLKRFLKSRQVENGAVPNPGSTPEKLGWLATCAKDNWESDWPLNKREIENKRWGTA